VIITFLGQSLGWLVFSALIISFIEHQVHCHMMHRPGFMSRFTSAFKRTFEAHALNHHKYYSPIFSEEPIGSGEDKEIRLTVIKGPIKTLPVILLIAAFSWQGALIFTATVLFHHWAWNKIHLEMHMPAGRSFGKWPVYLFLARHHYLHHKYQNKNFNVVFPFADYVLGTNAHATKQDLIAMAAEGFLPQAAPALTDTRDHDCDLMRCQNRNGNHHRTVTEKQDSSNSLQDASAPRVASLVK
jgi:hypothetical protein